MKNRLKSKVNATGRNGDRVGSKDRVLIVRRSLVLAPQFSALSPNARNLFWELHSMFNGSNRQTVFLSVRDATARIGLSDCKAASAAFDELMALGFLEESIGSNFRQKYDSKSRARAWRLMWIGPDGKCSAPDFLPDLDFRLLDDRQKQRQFRRSKTLDRYLKSYQQGKFAVEDSSTLDARRELTVEDSSTLAGGNGEKPSLRIVEDSSTHIDYHWGAGTDANPSTPSSGWWANVERIMAARPEYREAA